MPDKLKIIVHSFGGIVYGAMKDTPENREKIADSELARYKHWEEVVTREDILADLATGLTPSSDLMEENDEDEYVLLTVLDDLDEMRSA